MTTRPSTPAASLHLWALCAFAAAAAMPAAAQTGDQKLSICPPSVCDSIARELNPTGPGQVIVPDHLRYIVGEVRSRIADKPGRPGVNLQVCVQSQAQKAPVTQVVLRVATRPDQGVPVKDTMMLLKLDKPLAPGERGCGSATIDSSFARPEIFVYAPAL